MFSIYLVFLIVDLCCAGGVKLLERVRLPTQGNAGFEHFSIENQHFLAVANFWDGQSNDMSAESIIYRVDISPRGGLALSEVQRILTQGAHGWDFFTMTSGDGSTSHFLVASNYYGCGANRGSAASDCRDTTVIFKYNFTDGKFARFQRLASAGPAQSDHWITRDGSVFIVVGENFNNAVCLYRFVDIEFQKHSCIHVPGAGSIAITEIENSVILVATSYHDQGWKTRTKVFAADARVSGALLTFEEVQSIDTYGCHDAEIATFADSVYLFLSEDRSDTSSTIFSSLWRYHTSSSRFELAQRIPTDGAHAAELFLGPNATAFLAIANFGDRLGERFKSTSTLWRREENADEFSVDETTGMTVHRPASRKFVQVATMPSQGATDMEYFEMNSRHFVALSNEGNIRKRTHQTSVIYEIVDESWKFDVQM
jgi:hypothetical protein